MGIRLCASFEEGRRDEPGCECKGGIFWKGTVDGTSRLDSGPAVTREKLLGVFDAYQTNLSVDTETRVPTALERIHQEAPLRVCGRR